MVQPTGVPADLTAALAALGLAPTSHVVKITARYIPFSIVLAGIRWSADWSVEGGEISIRSAYGSARRKIGRRKPDLLARELLVEILCAKLMDCEARTTPAARALERKSPPPR